MQNLTARRLSRIARRAENVGLPMPSPVEALAAAQAAHDTGDRYALSGVGKVDLLAHLVKG